MEATAIASASAFLAFGCCVFRTAETRRQILQETQRQESQLSGLSQNGSELLEQYNAQKEKCTVYFGSQTGTAEELAQRTISKLRALGLAPKLCDLSSFDPKKLVNTELAIFYCSTYGEGDPPENAKEFHMWLSGNETAFKMKPSPYCLRQLQFTVFGLGNKQYECYNAMGRFIQRRLLELGGQPFYAYGEGDDNEDLQGDFESWHKGMLDVVARFASNGDGEEAHSTVSSYKFTRIDPPKDRTLLLTQGRERRQQHAKNPIQQRSSFFTHFIEAIPLKVVANEELRQSAGDDGLGSTRHIELDLRESGLSYSTADHLIVCPENNPVLVERAATALGLNLDDWFTLSAPNGSTPEIFPTPCTIRTSLTCYVALHVVPSQHLLLTLSECVDVQAHKHRLEYLGSSEGIADYEKEILLPRIDFVELFEMFDSFNLSELPEQGEGSKLGIFFENMPKLQPRYYTISSSPEIHPESIHVTARVVKEQKPGPPEGRMFEGVCTSFLARSRPRETTDSTTLNDLSRVYAYIRSSSFKLPREPNCPIILIASGAGIAPMRGFLQERSTQKASKRGETVLFFGCRREEEDYLYKSELEQFVKQGVLTKLRIAFSRDSQNRQYVQDLMDKDDDLIWDFLHNRRGNVYICGGVGMANGVKSKLRKIAKTKGSLSTSGARAYVNDLKVSERLRLEAWS